MFDELIIKIKSIALLNIIEFTILSYAVISISLVTT